MLFPTEECFLRCFSSCFVISRVKFHKFGNCVLWLKMCSFSTLVYMNRTKWVGKDIDLESLYLL